jgi:hypothetical protein
MVALAQPSPAPPESCVPDRDVLICTSAASRTETVERTMVADCVDAATGLPGRRVRAFVDSYAVTETVTVRRAGDGRSLDVSVTEMRRDLVGSRLISDTCAPSS